MKKTIKICLLFVKQSIYNFTISKNVYKYPDANLSLKLYSVANKHESFKLPIYYWVNRMNNVYCLLYKSIETQYQRDSITSSNFTRTNRIYLYWIFWIHEFIDRIVLEWWMKSNIRLLSESVLDHSLLFKLQFLTFQSE